MKNTVLGVVALLSLSFTSLLASTEDHPAKAIENNQNPLEQFQDTLRNFSCTFSEGDTTDTQRGIVIGIIKTAAETILPPFIEERLTGQQQTTSKIQLNIVPSQLQLLQIYVNQKNQNGCQETKTKIQELISMIKERIDATNTSAQK
jgi:hypothetical protein